MAAPTPSSIVTDPPPLNSTTFPYAVQPFAAISLRDSSGVLPIVHRGPETDPEENPHRYQS